jgi:hypothetical protein
MRAGLPAHGTQNALNSAVVRGSSICAVLADEGSCLAAHLPSDEALWNLKFSVIIRINIFYVAYQLESLL